MSKRVQEVGKDIDRYVQLVTLQASLAAYPSCFTPLLQWRYQSGSNYNLSDTHSIFLHFYLNTLATARMLSRSWPPRVSSTRRMRSILRRRELRFRITCSKRPASAYVNCSTFVLLQLLIPRFHLFVSQLLREQER